MLNILLITAGFPFGESERSFLNTEYNILKQNANLHILAITKSTETTQLENVNKFHDYRPSILEALGQLRYKIVRENIWEARKTSFICWLRRIKDIIAYSAHSDHIQKTLEKLINFNQISIVYTYWCVPATVAALRIKEGNKNIKVITRFHGFDLCLEQTKNNWHPLRNYISSNIDRMYFACKRSRDYYIKLYSYEEKCEVAYLGTKKRKYLGVPDRKDKIVLLSCSSVIPIKRVELIAETVYELSKKIKVEWYHIGGPTKRFKILDESGIKYNLLGQVPNKKIDWIYANVNPDLFITLSSTEGGTPVSIQEAFSMGIPALGTDVGGIPDSIIENETGYVVSMNAEPLMVSDKIVKHMQLHYKDKMKMSHNAYTLWKDQFNAEKNAESFLEKIINI